MKIFTALVPLSNENKSSMRVDESLQARVCTRVFSTLMFWSNENKSCMRVAEFTSESFLNSRVPVKREQEFYGS